MSKRPLDLDWTNVAGYLSWVIGGLVVSLYLYGKRYKAGAFVVAGSTLAFGSVGLFSSVVFGQSGFVFGIVLLGWFVLTALCLIYVESAGASGLANRRSLSGMLILYSLVPVLAFMITWLTGFFWIYAQGFPIPWEAINCTEVPAPYSVCGPGSYYWPLFGFDVIFYSVIGYALVLTYLRYHGGKPKVCLQKQT